MKNTITELWNRGLHHLVLEDSDCRYWLVAAASAVHEGNLIGDGRRWNREIGTPVFIKRNRDQWETPTPNSFVLPNGRVVEVASVLVRPQNNTCWLLNLRKTLPTGYIEI
ncbi:MAG TPA: hypothetical protein VMJ75_11360 [Candidatus Acidoferrales bacterium]|nr:hypothetical protein [Candidatus Acidoferrales bacterium]